MDTRKIIRLAVTESTNTAALEAAQHGASSGTVIVAETQTAGRGRLNRSWLSPPGMGLYFSLLLQPELAPEELPKITLAAGLAVCRTVETEYNILPKIKWPNDLLLDGRKFGGILTETGAAVNAAPGQKPLVVVGVGLNLFPPEEGFPSELQGSATSLASHVDRKISAEKLLETCVSAIETEIRRLEKGEFASILKEWSRRDGVFGKVLTWVAPHGKAVTGVSLGPGQDGVLRIRDEAGIEHEVISGDLSLVRASSENTRSDS